MRNTTEYGKCWRCKEIATVEGGGVLWKVYYAYLCMNCINAWELFAMDHPLLLASSALDSQVKMVIARTQHDGRDRSDRLDDIDLKVTKVKRDMFAVAESWVNQYGGEE